MTCCNPGKEPGTYWRIGDWWAVQSGSVAGLIFEMYKNMDFLNLGSRFLAVLLVYFFVNSQPIWAMSCAELMGGTTIAQNHTLAELIGQSRLEIKNSTIFQGNSKSLFLAQVDSWGRGDNSKHLFVLSMRLKTYDEARPFLEELVAQANISGKGTNWALASREHGFEVPGVFTARIHSPYYTRHLSLKEGALELEVEIQRSSNEIEIANLIGKVLLDRFQVKPVPRTLDHLSSYDLATVEGRTAWGIEVFYDWLKDLTSDAKNALRIISGPEYSDILPFLRGKERNWNSQISTDELQRLVSALDAAIEKGRLPVPVKIYRATTAPQVMKTWESLVANKNAQVKSLSDEAYVFSSLDEEFVQSWNRNELRGKGIILEIHASAGVKAGYIDRGPHERDYAEIVLSRGESFTPIRAYTNSTGEKRLIVAVQ